MVGYVVTLPELDGNKQHAMKTASIRRKTIVFMFRYGVQDHVELHNVIGEVLRRLGERYNVVYMGPNSLCIPESFHFPNVSYTALPYSVNRASSRDKFWKTLLWYVFLPWLAFYARWLRAELIWIDESLPAAGIIVEIISGRPVVLTVVDFFLEVYREKYRWMAPLSRLAFWLDLKGWKRARGLITRAESTRGYLIRQHVDSAKIITIRDAFDLNVFFPERNQSIRRRYGFNDQDVVIVHHGILHPNKGIGRVLEWMIPLMKADAAIKMLIVGGGTEFETLRQRVVAETLQGQAVFTGWLPSSRDVSDHLNAGDIGLVMRIGQFSDNFHVTGTLVHCLMCGLPVLAARLDGIREIITEGEEGLLFDPSSGTEFIAKLKVLLHNSGLRRQMGMKGRERAAIHFAPDCIVKQTVHSLTRFLGDDEFVNKSL